jgi:hypothetical protein
MAAIAADVARDARLGNLTERNHPRADRAPNSWGPIVQRGAGVSQSTASRAMAGGTVCGPSNSW